MMAGILVSILVEEAVNEDSEKGQCKEEGKKKT